MDSDSYSQRQIIPVNTVPNQPTIQYIQTTPPNQTIIPGNSGQPIQYTAPPTVIQPIVVPQVSSSSLQSRSASIDQQKTSSGQSISVTTSKLGDLYTFIQYDNVDL